MVIDKEINRNIYQNGNEFQKKIHLNFILDRILIDLIKNQNDKNSNVLSLKMKIGTDVYESIFNTKEVYNLMEQLSLKTINKKKVGLPKNVFLNINEDTGNKTVDKLLESTKFRVNLSIPVFTSDSKFCLIAYSNGFENSMSGGINIYIKEKNNWIYNTTFNEWIE
ncbi:hypothetical protein [Lacinutrix jangbogonensis]|uniref:hypothetical protein n=1 Tax=Lacinutrix jangbogonensis TaxID=1469557 RepID=UPI0012E05606|nr:hypothetical protein [Lacinutrix jangbogonensis]